LNIDSCYVVCLSRLELIGTRMLIDRLLRRNQHEFATRVTKLLHMPAEEGENRILVQWAVKEVCCLCYVLLNDSIVEE
jgi:hypothetical protein